jgi:hypothetical protein
LGGKAALTTAYTAVFTFLSRGYEHAVLLFDADSSIAEVVAEQRRRVEASLAEHHVSDRATAVPVVPAIEAWLVEEDDPKRKLRETIGRTPQIEDIQRLAQQVGLDNLAARNASFSEFRQTLMRLSALAAQQPKAGLEYVL